MPMCCRYGKWSIQATPFCRRGPFI